MRKRLAHLLRRAANRLDPRARRISIALTADVGSYVRGMNRASEDESDG